MEPISATKPLNGIANLTQPVAVTGKRAIDVPKNGDLQPRKKQKIEPPQLDDSKCSVWLPKKRRQCKHELVNGTKYCRFHLPTDDSQNIKRLKCKFCGVFIFKKKHQNSDAATNLAAHYKKCPVKRKLDQVKSQPFYHENIHFHGDLNHHLSTSANSDDDTKTDDNTENKENADNIISSTITSESMIKTLKSIQSSSEWNELTNVIDRSDNTSLPAVRALYLQNHKKKENLKHCTQIESIITNMQRECPLIKQIADAKDSNSISNPIILELGGGKGSFGSMLHGYWKEKGSLIIIDIHSNFRNKEDNRLLNVNNVSRIQCGLQHCNLSKVEDIGNIDGTKDRGIFVISKHLCGAATDFGLRCVLNDENVSQMKIEMIAIALCCRGKCSAETYCNVKYLRKVKGLKDLKKEEFEMLRSMASWEVDGGGRGLSKEQKVEHKGIGTICRRLLDEGRARFLREKGFEVKFVKYINAETTKENILLLATRPK